MVEDPRPRAAIYVRRLDDVDACHSHCEARGYRTVGLVYDPAGERYHDLAEAALRGEMEVIVIRRMSDLPADRMPRTEVVEDALGGTVRHRRRRPRPAS